MELLSSNLTILIGHYGSGKTTLAVNLAYQAGGGAALADIDVNNPYFRSRDWLEKFENHGIELIIPAQEIAYAEMPYLPANIYGSLQSEKKLILDVGGSQTGTTVLGSLAQTIQSLDYKLWFVVNAFRPGTETKEEIIELYHQLETISRLSISGIVNNSNLADMTEAADVLYGEGIVHAAADELGVPFIGNCLTENLAIGVVTQSPTLVMERVEKLTW